MSLRDWEVIVRDDEPADGGYASVDCVYGRKIANVRISDELLGDPPENQRQSLIHELLHAHFTTAYEVADESLPEPIRPVYRRLAEGAIDGIATAWAPSMPLP